MSKIYISSKSLINTRLVKDNILNSGTTVLPLDNIYLNDVDGITKPFRVTWGSSDTVSLEIWSEFMDQPGTISHLMLNDISVSKNATWSIWYYSKTKLEKDWEGTTAVPSEANTYLDFVAHPSNTGTYTLNNDHIQFDEWKGTVYIKKSQVTDWTEGDARYMCTWKTKTESGSVKPSNTNTGAHTVYVDEGAFEYIFTRYWNASDVEPTYGACFNLTIDETWTGEIWGMRTRYQEQYTFNKKMIDSQFITLSDFSYNVFEHSHLRGTNDVYPVNAIDFVTNPTEIQAITISIVDSSSTIFDVYNLHLGGGYDINTPVGISYQPILPGITVVPDSGLALPQDGVPVKKWNIPVRDLSHSMIVELSRILHHAEKQPIVAVAFKEDSNVPFLKSTHGAEFNFWTIFGYINNFEFRARDRLFWDGTIEIIEIRASSL